MILSYLWRSMIRNKVRSLLIMVGIIVSIMLVSGVNIASNQMARYMIKERLDTVKVDYQVRSSNENITANLDRLASLDQEFDEYLTSYAVGRVEWEETLYLDNATAAQMNWTAFLDPDNFMRSQSYNYTEIYGLGSNVFQNEEIRNRFSDTLLLPSEFNLNRPGLYIDADFANTFGLEPNDTFSIHYIYSEYGGNGDPDDYIGYSHHIELANITVLGVVNILDTNNFGELMGSRYSYFREDTRFFIGNLTYIANLTESLREAVEDVAVFPVGDVIYYGDFGAANRFTPSISYGVFLDHDALVDIPADQLISRLVYIDNRITRAGEGDFTQVYSALADVLSYIQLEMAAYQTLFLIVSLPVLILGWYLAKTNWILSYQRRRREIALLKVKGGISKQLKGMFFLEALIVGLLGGLLGIFGGNFTSTLVLSRIYPQALMGQTIQSTFTQLFTGQFLRPVTWVIGLLGGALMSILAVRKPLSQFAQMAPIEGLAKYHESTHTAIPKKKRDWVFLAIGALPILISLATEIILNNVGFNAYIILGPLMGISTALLPFAPFILTYALVKLLCRNISVFQKVIDRISRLFSKSISVFTSKSIINNQARSFRLVFIVAMALSFLVLASTVEGSELAYQQQRQTLLTGDGLRIDYYGTPLGMFGIGQMAADLHSEESGLNISAVNWYGMLDGSGIAGQNGGNYEDDYIVEQYPSMYSRVYAVSAENYSNFINIKENWFTTDYSGNILEKLATGNYCLIPDDLVNKGYLIGENLTIEYASSNISKSGLEERELVILGSYAAFPLIPEYQYESVIIVDNSTLQDGIMNQVTLALYPESGQPVDSLNAEAIMDYLDDWRGGGYSYQYYNSGDETEDVTGSLLRFLDLETYYLMTIVSFGIAIIMYISINEKSHDMGLLRARGVEKRVIYKIQFAEGITLIILGGLFTFTGILGGASIIFQLNNLFNLGGMNTVERTLFIPWGKMLLQLGGSLLAFLVSIVIAVGIETRKSDVTKIGDLLRVSS